MDIASLTLKPTTPQESHRSFTFRNIPSTTHQAWKIGAAAVNLSMEEFGLIAIQNLIREITKPAPPPIIEENDGEESNGTK